MNRAVILVAILVGVLACEDSPLSSCIRGEVVGYERCSNAVLIQVEKAYAIGEALTYYDHRSFDNVIRAPGKFGEYGDSIVYFTFRRYQHENDSGLFGATEICPSIYGPFDVPTVVITASSRVRCCNETE